MSTYNQLVRNPRQSKKKKVKRGLGSPQREAVCDEVSKMTPNKPNSALRSIAKLKIKTKKLGKMVFAYIPGEGHNLQKYSVVLVQGGGAQDLTGVRRSVVRGAKDRDAKGVENRKQGRSKYGTKK